MSVLDTFVFLFRGDTGQLSQDLNRAENAANDAAQQVDNMSDSTDGLAGTFKDLAVQVAAAVAGFFALDSIVDQASETASLYQWSQALNMNIEDLDAFGKAATAAGGDSEGFRDTLVDVSEKIGEALQDAESGAAETFKKFNIGLKDVQGQTKNAGEVFLELADAVQGMSKQEAIFKLKELGIGDNKAIEMILKGRKSLEEMIKTQKELGTVTKEDAEIAIKFNTQVGMLQNTFKSLAVDAGGVVLPVLTKFFELVGSVVNWLRANEKFATGFFIAIAGVLAYMYLPAVISAATATWAMIAPFLAVAIPVVAAAAAFALLYDDIMTFLDGGDSMVGKVSQTYPIVGETIKTIAQIVGNSIDYMIAFFERLTDVILHPIESFNQLKNAAQETWDSITSKFGDTVFGGIDAAVGSVQGAFASVTGNPLGAQTSNSIANSANSSKTNNVKIDTVTVQTQATDAKGISAGISDALSNKMRQAVANYDDGVAI